MSIDDVVPIARQIAEALEAAHEQGIVHRDLKPANIKVRPDGTVKVLDFGLAKAMEQGSGIRDRGSGSLSQSPTITTPAMPFDWRSGHPEQGRGVTQAGMILGTAAYMSPEQARGKAVDKRADIWAFGCVLYEALTGRRAFGGEDVTDTIVAVVSKEPDWSAVPSEALHVDALLRRCLEKDPKRRLRDIGEARIMLERLSSGVVETGRVPMGGAQETPPVSAASRRTPWIVAALATAVAIVLGALQDLRPAPAARSLVLEMAAPRDTGFTFGSNQGAGVISPDGSAVAFLARSQDRTSLWVRSLATGEARALPGTEGAFYPFWSPDSRTLGFFVPGQLMKVDIGGGLPEAVAAAGQGRGGSWSDTGEILFTPVAGGSVHRVSADGGPVEEVTRLDTARGENAHYWPVWLPGGTRFLYFVRSTRAEDNAIYLGSLDGRPPVRLVTSLSSGAYAPPLDGHPGYLLWARDDELLAQPLDVDAGRLTGDAVVVTSDVRVEDAQRALLATVSSSGTIVWASASATGSVLTWYDRDGRRGETVPIAARPIAKLAQPRLSLDGRQLAFVRVTGGTADIWVYDVENGTTMQVTTDPGYDENPVWSPDSTSLAYSSGTGSGVISRVTLEGSRTDVSLQAGPLAGPASFTPDAAFLILGVEGAETGRDLAYVNASHPGAVMPLVVETGEQEGASVSLDGRWIAFSHELSGRPQVVVAPLAREGDTLAVGRPWLPVSRDGGSQPLWRNDSRELVFVGADLMLYSVAVAPAGATLRVGQPDALFRLPVDSGGSFSTATPDLRRFVVIEEPGAVGQTLHVMTNWQAHIAR